MAISNTQQKVDQRDYAVGYLLAFGPEPEWGTNWDYDSYRYFGRILRGKYAHYCLCWDELPIDETCVEFCACECYNDEEASRIRTILADKYFSYDDFVDKDSALDEYLSNDNGHDGSEKV